MNPMLKAKIIIEAIDNDGNRRELPIRKWSEITGKSYDMILFHYNKKRKYGLKITNRQVVGLQAVDLAGGKRARDKESRLRIKAKEKDNISLVNGFLRKSLVGGSLEGMSLCQWSV